MASTLKNFIHSLDPKALPRILQIQSGFYDEGTIYETSGHESCLSTGDVIKVVDLKVKKLLASNSECEDDSLCTPTMVELPLNFPGFCRLVVDRTPYVNIEEIVRKVWIGPTQQQYPSFYCSGDLEAGNLSINKGEKIIFSSVEDNNGTATVTCRVEKNGQVHDFLLPVSQEGDFYESEDNQVYSLKEVAEWKIPKSRCRHVMFTHISDLQNHTDKFPVDFDGCVVLSPIYEVQAVMKFQKEVVHFLSDLDVEVKDVTDCYNVKSFLQPLSMEDILERTSNDFPICVAVIEGPSGNKQPYNLLCPGREIVIYKKHQAIRILASEIKSGFKERHFLIPTSYKGKFKRKPREFLTAYDLEIARSGKEKLHVIATKAFESPCEEQCSVSIGDQFLIPQCQTHEIDQKRKEVENALTCEQILLGNKIDKKVFLPMCMEGGFVEIVHDKKEYELLEICKDFCMPCNVKVSIRDPSVQEDILAGIQTLQLEEEIRDTYLLISNFNNSTEIWDVPVHRVNMTAQLLSKDAEDVLRFPVNNIVEEITEEQYCMMRRYEKLTKKPPPRPPKAPMIKEPKKSFTASPAQKSLDAPKPVKNLYAEANAEWLSNPTAAVLGLQLSCQSDLEHKNDMSETATFEESPVIRARKTFAENKPSAGHELDDEDKNVTNGITKKNSRRTI
ncbi:protein THEMIS [Paroedura picta]|uniref:protein THEMIS n=1 Tax=Paroedura picta TaxID=143630 RepID=UPI0040560131